MSSSPAPSVTGRKRVAVVGFAKPVYAANLPQQTRTLPFPLSPSVTFLLWPTNKHIPHIYPVVGSSLPQCRPERGARVVIQNARVYCPTAVYICCCCARADSVHKVGTAVARSQHSDAHHPSTLNIARRNWTSKSTPSAASTRTVLSASVVAIYRSVVKPRCAENESLWTSDTPLSYT